MHITLDLIRETSKGVIIFYQEGRVFVGGGAEFLVWSKGREVFSAGGPEFFELEKLPCYNQLWNSCEASPG